MDAKLADEDGILVTLLQGGTLEATVAQMDEKAASKCLDQLTKGVRELATGIEQRYRVPLCSATGQFLDGNLQS